MTSVRTRFAPSPTGYLHIGGMRTALFNWLFTRRHGGQFVLRIDDTDASRNIDEAIAPIQRAFRWLELDWDEGPEVGGVHGPYFQSQRGGLYRAAAERLLREGTAYRCFDSAEQVAADREAARHLGRTYLNVRRSLELSDAGIRQRLEAGQPHVLRLVVPRDQTFAIDDAVRGHVEWDGALMADPVIVRSDGSPLYNFATAVDDAAMQITHVIRAEEHLSNTPVQVLIHRGLGQTLPVFAHLPFVAAPGLKEKLSKRKLDVYRTNPQFRRLFDRADAVFDKLRLSDERRPDPVMVEYYERMGYRPEAIVNALARLGWSLDDKTEIMSRSTIIRNFSLDRVVKSPASLDPEKLASFQAYWMSQQTGAEKLDGCLPFLTAAGYVDDPPDEATRAFVGRLIVAMADRLKVFSDVLAGDEFFVADEELHYDDQVVARQLRKADVPERLARFRDRLARCDPFDAATLERWMDDFVESEGIKLGGIIHAVRVAVTGKSVGIGIFDTLALLGRERCLGRIDLALSRLR